MSFIKEPLSRLKYGFPVERQIPYEFGKNIKDDTSIDTDEEPELKIEYRDEKGRKWWKFFDEYEYRSNNHTRSKHKWFKWYNENDTPAERKLLFKLDIMLTFYSLMAYWVKYLDQTNLNNAYTSGLKEGIGMVGNDLVDTQVVFNIGNIIFQIPFIYLLNVAPMNYLLPGFDILWSIVTICIYKSTNVATLKGLRFLVGAFEAQAYYSYHFLFGSWFTADEISRRAMIFYFGQYLGVLTSGLLSGAIVRNLDGVGGLQSWQWIFIIDGLISLGVGIIGIYSIPGTPKNCYSIFLSDEEIQLARRRIERHNVGTKHDNYNIKDLINLDLWKSILTSWEFYILSWWNIFLWNGSNATGGSYILWLKSLTKTDSSGNTVQRYSTGELQDKSALTPGLGLIWLFLTCTSADLFHSRWGSVVFSQILNIIGNVLLAVWDVNERTKWFAFCLQYFGWAVAPVIYSWQGDICRRDQQKRSIILIFMNAFAQSTTAFMAVLVWKTVEAPRYLKGFTFTACCAFALILWTFIVLYFYKRSERQNAIDNGIVLYNSSNPDDIPEAVKQHNSDNKEQTSKEEAFVKDKELPSEASSN